MPEGTLQYDSEGAIWRATNAVEPNALNMAIGSPEEMNLRARNLADYWGYSPRLEYICDLCGHHDDAYRPYAGEWEVRVGTPDGEVSVCETCYDNQERCLECGRLDCYYNLDNSGVCEKCAATRSYVRDYSFKPSPKFWGKEPPNHAYFGIELETECASKSDIPNVSQALFDMSDNESLFYQKYDGSLYNGIEIVSHPRTLESWRSFCDDKFGAVLYELAKMGSRSWAADSCGLHVHVSYRAFDDSYHLERFALLFNRNQARAKRFARRSSSYAQFDSDVAIVSAKAKGDLEPDHYDAVNMGGNDGETIEVRIFKPSLAIGRVMGSIECVAAAVEFTRPMDIEDVWGGALDWDNFAAYLAENGYEYASRIEQGKNFRAARALAASALGRRGDEN